MSPFYIPLTLILLLTSVMGHSDELIPWEYNSVNSETLPTWRFLAVSDEASPLPSIEKTRIGVVDLPWQLERMRPKGFYMTTVQVAERFSNREVLLELETIGLTRVYFNGALDQESLQGVRSRMRIQVRQRGGSRNYHFGESYKC